MARAVAMGSTLCLLLLLLYLWFGPADSFPLRTRFDAPAIVRQVRDLNQLVTVKYTVQKIVGLEEPRGAVGRESILLLVEAKVLAGVDLADLTETDVTMPRPHEAAIRLPPARITEAFLEERNTKVWNRGVTWWTPWIAPDKDLEHKARLAALDQVRAAASGMGIVADAQRNAETGIRGLLRAFGFTKVTFARKET